MPTILSTNLYLILLHKLLSFLEQFLLVVFFTMIYGLTGMRELIFFSLFTLVNLPAY